MLAPTQGLEIEARLASGGVPALLGRTNKDWWPEMLATEILNPNGPTKNNGGRIGHPISIGGVTVHPGDFVIGDGDGVVVVEREVLPGLLPLAEHKVQAEAKRIAQIQQGNTSASWLTASLVAAGVLKEGETL